MSFMNFIHSIAMKRLNIRTSTERYKHVAVIFGKVPLYVGINSSREYYAGCKYGRHAEMDVLKKLKPKLTGRRKKISLLVIRGKSTGKLKYSKPCKKCIYEIEKVCYIKGYSIKYIYYSGKDGNIIKETLTSLKRKPYHVSFRFRI